LQKKEMFNRSETEKPLDLANNDTVPSIHESYEGTIQQDIFVDTGDFGEHTGHIDVEGINVTHNHVDMFF
jgi:hypothetical protein